MDHLQTEKVGLTLLLVEERSAQGLHYHNQLQHKTCNIHIGKYAGFIEHLA